MRIKLAVFSFSLFLGASALGDFAALNREVQTAPDFKTAGEIVRSSPLAAGDKDLADLVAGSQSETLRNPEARLKALRDGLELRALAESGKSTAEAAAQAKSIKKSPFFKDPEEKSESNWLDDSVKNLEKMLSRVKPPEAKVAPPSLHLSWLQPLMYILLAGLLVAFLLYAASQFGLRKGLKRKSAAVMEEDEPERSLDEWLTMADDLERQGKYREAVRCLYLACLIRFDEARIARFIRSQTNWEHLARIETSPTRLEAFDFRSPTKAFDHIWYGHRTRGQADVTQFREWYTFLTLLLEKVAAA